MYRYKITVLTPTYNRANLIRKLYNSLLLQNTTDFQWLIIDDGSTDLTSEVVKGFQQENKIKIDYYYKPNGGKHTALNYSHPYIDGELLFIVDSDDYLPNNAISEILAYWEQYKGKQGIRCMTFLKGNEKGKSLSGAFPNENIISNTIDFRINMDIRGDCCEVLLSDVFKEYRFPVFDNEKFVPEGCLWNYIGFRYNTVYINKILYYAEYLDGGLTRSGRKLRINNPNGCMTHCLSFFEKKNNRTVNLKKIIKESILFSCYGKFAGYNRKKIISLGNNERWIRINYFLGVILYSYWKQKYSK